MSGCNATLTVLLEGDDCESMVLKTLTCDYDDGHAEITKHVAAGATVLWEDTSPGATPHQDPTPTYWVHENYKGQWFVLRNDGESYEDHVVCFDPSHPDPKGAAKAEAARLNGVEHHVDFMAQRADEARAEADRYRETLRAVLSLFTERGHPGRECLRTPWVHVERVEDWRRVLDGGDA